MRALITGGTGFVGSHLAERLLAQGAEVTLFDRDCHRPCYDFEPGRYRCLEGDIRSAAQLKEAFEGQEVVYHLAGVLGTDYLVDYPAAALEVNVGGTLNVLEAARSTGALVVCLSLLPRWSNPYMITKHCAEEFCRFYSLERGVRTVTIKATHIYGPRQRWQPVQKAVPTFVRAALAGRPLPVYATGRQLVDLLYVEDAAQALERVTRHPELWGRSIELGSGRGIQVGELARRIIELCGSSSRIEARPMRPGEPDRSDSFRLAGDEGRRLLLAGRDPVGPEEGLRLTIAWYRRYGAIEPGGEEDGTMPGYSRPSSLTS